MFDNLRKYFDKDIIVLKIGRYADEIIKIHTYLKNLELHIL